VIDCLRDLAHPTGRLKAALFLLVGRAIIVLDKALRRLPRPLAPAGARPCAGPSFEK
jgi:hypothetical protein